jgi:uncharacterized RDD family membrane protein YckC
VFIERIARYDTLRMSEMTWYYSQNSQQFGPISHADLLAQIQAGRIGISDLVWRPGMANWLPAGSLPELAAAFPAAGTPGFLLDPANPQAISTGTHPLNYYTPPPGTTPSPYAGFWIRFCAAFVDGLVLIVPNMLIAFGSNRLFGIGFMHSLTASNARSFIAANLVSDLFTLPLYIGYFALMESSARQASLGKQACRLFVTDSDMLRLTFPKAALRTAMKQLAMLITMPVFAMIILLHPAPLASMLSFNVTQGMAGVVGLVGYCMAGVTPRKRALHDMIAGTLVMRHLT